MICEALSFRFRNSSKQTWLFQNCHFSVATLDDNAVLRPHHLDGDQAHDVVVSVQSLSRV